MTATSAKSILEKSTHNARAQDRLISSPSILKKTVETSLNQGSVPTAENYYCAVASLDSRAVLFGASSSRSTSHQHRDCNAAHAQRARRRHLERHTRRRDLSAQRRRGEVPAGTRLARQPTPSPSPDAAKNRNPPSPLRVPERARGAIMRESRQWSQPGVDLAGIRA